MILKSLYRWFLSRKCPHCGCKRVEPEATYRNGDVAYRCNKCSQPFDIKRRDS